MAIIVQVTGGLLALAGLVGLVFGIDMLPTERGVAAVIASVTALTGGVVTAAIGIAIQRLDTLLNGLGVDPVIRTSRPAASDFAPVPMTPTMPPPEAPPLRIDPDMDELLASSPAATKAPVAPVVPPQAAEPAVQPSVERSKFSLPGMKIGAGLAAAGAAVGAAVSRSTKSASEAEQAVEAALADLKRGATRPVAADLPPDPPVEILTPVVDEIEPVTEPMVAPAMATTAPEPDDEPAVAVRETEMVDPFQAFEAELDRLIPLKSGKKAKGRKDAATPAPEPAPEPQTAPVSGEAEPEAPAPVEVEPAPEAAVAAAAEPAPDHDVPMSEPRPGATVVGSYESGGAKYTMYSDGSVIAEAEGQRVRFNNLEELREFIDGGPKEA